MTHSNRSPAGEKESGRPEQRAKKMGHLADLTGCPISSNLCTARSPRPLGGASGYQPLKTNAVVPMESIVQVAFQVALIEETPWRTMLVLLPAVLIE